MNKLELMIPPVGVLVITLLLMGLSSLLFDESDFSLSARVAWFVIFSTVSMSIAGLGVLQFRKAKTSLSPLNPDKASFVVSSGIFAYTRNPMYLGMVLGLIAVVGLLGYWSLLFWVAAFAIYLNEFQIKPEEKILQEKFSQEYKNYQQRVRRWI